MRHRRFGKTELQMPVISFGCMRSMHSWTDMTNNDIPPESTTTLETLLHTALSHGINHFETARGYGSSERQLGQVLPRFQRNDYILQTKVGPSDDPEEFTANFFDSLERLQVDHVDLLAIHGINDHQSLWQSCRKNGCLAAARKLQRQGKALHIGFSGHGPLDVILQAIEHDEDGGFDFINLHWYYIYTINQPAIQRAADRDMGVYIISPTDKGGMLYNPSETLKALCQPLSPILFNDIYCLSQPGVSSLSVGASKLTDFDEHLKAQETTERPQLVLDIIHRLEEKMAQETGYKRPEGSWDELPHWKNCPGTINLRFIQWLDNLRRGWGLTEFAQTRYGMLNNGSAWVQGNDASFIDKVDFEEIRAKYPAVSVDLLQQLQDAHPLLKKNTAE